jgi:repressor LexA
MSKLTPRQSEILELIREFVANTGFPPTQAEIADQLGFRSANAAKDHLRALERKGAIELIPGSSRGIRLLGHDEGLPVIGRVAAGSPILAEQHIERHCRFDPGTFSPQADYLLRVRGMSMRDIGILDGDLLAVHKTQEARNGQIVVARLHDEVTVKRFEQHRHQVRLIAENPEFAPIEIDLRRDELTIEGLAVGVIRDTLF